jgi:hypothetical protein
MNLYQRVRNWWFRERLFDAVIAAVEQRVGVTEANWEMGTASDAVLAWFDAQLGAQRTPYGINGAKVVVVQGDRLAVDLLITPSEPWWWQQREAMAAALPDLIETGAIDTGVVAVGTATHTVLEQWRQRRSFFDRSWSCK